MKNFQPTQDDKDHRKRPKNWLNQHGKMPGKRTRAQRPWLHAPRHSGFRAKRRTLFGRFMGFLLFLALPLIGLGVLFGTLISGSEFTHPRLTFFIAAICGIPLMMALVIGTIGTLAFRNLGTPLASIMAAADAVADGDLSTRVEERGPGEFRRMARSFNRMTSELERADLQRRNLTADVAHELRTPLHILQGNLEGLQDGVYQSSPEHIQAMLEETQMLARLVDDLQILSLAETGQLPLHFERVDINELIADVSTSFSGPIDAAGIDLQVEIEGSAADSTITGDVERLDQVLSNLLGNALRYTPSGGSILLKAAATLDEVLILVRDTGEGISSEDLPFIFDRFWRGDKSRKRLTGAGSGLGLAISRQFVLAHGGRISVESQLGEGTAFKISIPKDYRP